MNLGLACDCLQWAPHTASRSVPRVQIGILAASRALDLAVGSDLATQHHTSVHTGPRGSALSGSDTGGRVSAWPHALSGWPASVLGAPRLMAHNLPAVLTQASAICPASPRATSSLDCLIPAPSCLSPVHSATATHCVCEARGDAFVLRTARLRRGLFPCPPAGPKAATPPGQPRCSTVACSWGGGGLTRGDISHALTPWEQVH